MPVPGWSDLRVKCAAVEIHEHVEWARLQWTGGAEVLVRAGIVETSRLEKNLRRRRRTDDLGVDRYYWIRDGHVIPRFRICGWFTWQEAQNLPGVAECRAALQATQAEQREAADADLEREAAERQRWHLPLDVDAEGNRRLH
jgi:hypothetical protein